MPSLADKPKTMGQVLKSLRSFYPDFTWSSKLHSNMIRGRKSDDSTYSLTIVHFHTKDIFEASIRGADINCRSHSKNCVEAIDILNKKLHDKQQTITEIIKDLS